MAHILDTIRKSGRGVADVAREAGVDRTLIYKIENGGDPHLTTVVKLANALGVRPAVLFPELGE